MPLDNKQNLFKTILKTLGLFILLEVAIQLLGSLLASGLWSSILNGRFSSFAVSEAVVFMLVLWFILIKKRWQIFKEKKYSFKETLKLCLPILILTIIIFISNVISLIGENLNIENLISLIFYTVFIGLFEELFFRGIIENELLENYKGSRKNIIVSIVLSAIFFGGTHILNLFAGQGLFITLMQIIQTFAIGLLFGAVYYLSKNIWALAFLHGFYDFAILLGDVNNFKECSYTKDMPLSLSTSSIVVSLILSAIYITYTIYLLRKTKMNDLSSLTDEDFKHDEKLVVRTKVIITALIVFLVIFNGCFNLFWGDKLNKYYVCYQYEKIKINKIETHYFSYDDYNISFKNSNDEVIKLHIYLKNKTVYIGNDEIKDIKVNVENVERLVVFQNTIMFITNDLTNYKLYYGNYLNVNNADNLEEYIKQISNNFVSFDIPDTYSLGYLVDADNGNMYPMIKSSVNDIYVVKENKMYLVN